MKHSIFWEMCRICSAETTHPRSGNCTMSLGPNWVLSAPGASRPPFYSFTKGVERCRARVLIFNAGRESDDDGPRVGTMV